MYNPRCNMLYYPCTAYQHARDANMLAYAGHEPANANALLKRQSPIKPSELGAGTNEALWVLRESIPRANTFADCNRIKRGNPGCPSSKRKMLAMWADAASKSQ